MSWVVRSQPGTAEEMDIVGIGYQATTGEDVEFARALVRSKSYISIK
jgi:hypothetical protein